MRTFHLVPLLLLQCFAIAGFSACVKPKALVAEPVSSIPTRDLTESVSLLGQTHAVCGARTGCLPSVGFLAAANAGGVGLCTAVLIGPDLVLTNSHCVPEDLKQSGASCANRVRIAFPAQDAAGIVEEVLDCDEVVSVSAIGDPAFLAVPDYALLRLSHASQRRPISLGAANGVGDSELLSVHRATLTSSDRPLASIDSAVCRSVMNSAVLPSYNRPNSPILLLADCPMAVGNSGAAILDSQGKLAALLQSTLSESMRRQFMSVLTTPNLPQFSFAAWVGCIRSAEDLDGPQLDFDSAACALLPAGQPVPDLVRAAYAQADVKTVDSEIGRAVVSWDLTDVAVPKAIEWQARTLTTLELQRLGVFGSAIPDFRDTVYIPVPSCFRPLSEWRDERRYRGSVSVGLANWYQEAVSLPIWLTHKSLDSYLRGVVRIVQTTEVQTAEVRKVSADFSFSPRDVKSDQGSVVELEGAGINGAGVALINGTIPLPICSAVTP